MDVVVQNFLFVAKVFKTWRLWGDPTSYRGEVNEITSLDDENVRLWTEYLDAGKIKLEQSTDNTSPPPKKLVLMISGGFESSQFYIDVFMNRFLDQDYHVIRYDNRGMGLSSWCTDFKKAPYGICNMATDGLSCLEHWLNKIASAGTAESGGDFKLDEFLIVGHSMGGSIAQRIGTVFEDMIKGNEKKFPTIADMLAKKRIQNLRFALISTLPYPALECYVKEHVEKAQKKASFRAEAANNVEDEKTNSSRSIGSESTEETKSWVDTYMSEELLKIYREIKVLKRDPSFGSSFKNFGAAQVKQKEILKNMHGTKYPFVREDFEARLDRAIRRGGVCVNCSHINIGPYEFEKAVNEYEAGTDTKWNPKSWEHLKRDFNVKTIVMHGNADKLVTEKAGKEVFFRLKNDMQVPCEYHELDTMGHRFHPDEFMVIADKILLCTSTKF